MKDMRQTVLQALLTCALVLPLSAQKVPFNFDTMMRIARISEPQLSPDGKSVAFTAQRIDLAENTKPSQIYIVPVEGGAPQQITREGSSNTRPQWIAGSEHIVFVSNRSGKSQIWQMRADGSETKQLTNLSTEANGVTVSPDGKQFLFTSDVYPSCGLTGNFDDSCNQDRLTKEQESKVKARIYTKLLYRHWNEYGSVRRRHLFIQDLDESKPRDLTPGNFDVPPFSLGGPDGYAISPDSKEVAYVANTDEDLATSTNSDLFTISTAGGEAKRITSNPAADEGPRYSPDGKLIAYRTQSRAGYESDRWRLVVIERASGRIIKLTEGVDRPVQEYTWSPDSSRLFVVTEDHGKHPLSMTSLTGNSIQVIAAGNSSISDVQFTADGKTMIYTEQSASRPTEIFRAVSKGGTGMPLTRLNDAIFSQSQLSSLEQISVDGAKGDKVESFLVKPPNFNLNTRYPVIFLIHGGPQGSWGESWSYRWNPQVFAGAGYLVVMPNPRGSTGYGQQFTDGVNADWGGRAYEDIMATVDYVQNLPYVDKDRMGAAGGSYGGYMVNWILGHTNRFKALVSHAGVFDLRSEAGETEELWFPKWEFQGMPWDNPELYARWSPSYYVRDFRTPTLVIHGELDYRVPVGQGQQLFTALQLKKVHSKLIQFPDEGHWIQKPQNSALWYNSVLDWFNEFLKNPSAAKQAAN